MQRTNEDFRNFRTLAWLAARSYGHGTREYRWEPG
jgi:hypothetical protein